MKYRFSVITCTYNSNFTLIRVYHSLLAQKFKNFEWVLVDDFSTINSGTRELINSFVNEGLLNIKKIFLDKNYLAAQSVKSALSISEGEYAVILDHDDEFFNNSLYEIDLLLKQHNEKEIAGVIARCENEHGVMYGKSLSVDNIILTQGQVIFEHKVVSELIHFIKSEILNECFKDFKPGYSNGYSWAKSSFLGAKFIMTNKIIRKYYSSIPTSISNNNSITKKFSKNIAQSMIDTLCFYRPYLFKKNIFYTIVIILNYYQNSESIISSIRQIKDSVDRKLFYFIIFLAPLAILKKSSIGQIFKFGNIINLYSK